MPAQFILLFMQILAVFAKKDVGNNKKSVNNGFQASILLVRRMAAYAKAALGKSAYG
jgi:hypothetical protein